MADLKLHVSVEKGQLDALKKEIDSFKSKKIKVEIDSTALEKSAKEMEKFDKETKDTMKVLTDFYNASNRVKVAENELARAKQEVLKAQNQAKAAIEQGTTAYNKYRAETEKTRQEELKLQREIEKGSNIQKKSAEGLKDIGNAAEQAGKKTQGFISTFVKSAIIYQAIYAIRQAFLDALDTMKEVDSQLVTVRKVTQATDAEISQMRSKAYQTASKYGVGAGDYLESVAQFARAGYKDMSSTLAELSTKTQIVGDTTAEVANQFLLSMDAAYKYEGSVQKLTRVLDGANEIDNNYATSIEKIAEGLGLIAPIASQVHVSEQELTSAIGTITAVTQRSGSEAARALRALFLNIIGDTTTEIEDGVTATEESVTSLRDLLKEYAPDAVKAAEATGEIIDPMEAIGALSQAMEKGFLTEQELMEKLSALGGKLRTSQLVALVSNYKMYTDMMGTYADSVGSADAEVENALDSWERKTAILANTWTEFIQGSLDTGFIKGFIDGLTQILKLFGNLGNMLITVGGAFVALKLPAMINSFTKWKESIAEANYNMGSFGGNLSKIQIGVAAVTAALTAAIMIWNAHRQAIEEDIAKAEEKASQDAQEVQGLYELKTAYEESKAAYEDGTGTKEAYESATKALRDALDEEAQAAFDAGTAIETLMGKELEEARQSADLALKKKTDDMRTSQQGGIDWLVSSSQMGLGALQSWASGNDQAAKMIALVQAIDQGSKSAQEYARNVVSVYDQAIAKQKEINEATKDGTERTAEQNKEWNLAQAIIEHYADDVENLRTQLENIDMFDAMEAGTWEEAQDALEGTSEAAEKAAEQYGSLSDAVKKAEGAIKDFNDATKTEKDDTFKSYADIYESFLTDWEAGLKGSNKVQAAIKALLPEDALKELWAQGKDAGDLLASEFYQGIFTYIDENGARQFTKGEDRGSLLAYALWDNDQLTQMQEDGSKIIKLGDDIVATLRQDGEELSVSVDDFDALAEALYRVTGVPLSSDYLASWMSALGMYTPELQMTAQELKDLAEAAGALNGNTINLQDFVQGQLDLGTPAENIRQMVDKLLELKDAGDVDVDIQADSVDTAKSKVNALIEEYQKTKDEKIGADTKEAETNINAVTDAANEYKNGSPYVSILKVDDQASASILGAISLAKQFEISARNAAANAQAAMNSVTPGGGSNKMATFASGTSSAPGGMTLVNEQGPEVIQEGAFARIAGGGMPTITWVQPGATIYNAGQTKSILGGIDPSIMFGGIGAFAGGTASGITRWSGSKITSSTASASSSSSSSGAYSGGGGGSSSSRASSASAASSASSSAKNEKDEHLEYLKSEVSLREAALALMKAQNLPVKNLIDEEKQIQSALMNEINYLKQIGASDEEIYKLYTQWYNVQKEIADLQKGMLDDLSKAISGQINNLNKAREAEKKVLQDQIDEMEKARDTRDEQLELEEKILAVQKAEQALQNAMTERTVRFYNASTGQWEWAANASNVKSAAEQLESAQKDLLNYQENAEINALKAQQEEIDARYDDLEDRWQTIIDSLAEPVQSIDDALNVLARNYVPAMEQDIINLNKLIESFGYHVHRSTGTVSHSGGLPVYDNGGLLSGIGGIKATALNEMILPPDITQRMLSVGGGSLIGERLNELRYLYGVTGSMRGNVSNSIGSQHNGDLYQYGNITLSAAQAESMTVAELARASRNLRLYSANM